MMLTQAVVTMVLLGHASATRAVPLIAFMGGPRDQQETFGMPVAASTCEPNIER